MLNCIRFFLAIFISLSAMSAAPSCGEILAKTVVASDLPETAVVIALGRDVKSTSLQTFADHLARQLSRRVVTYRNFSEVQYTFQSGKWWQELPVIQVTKTVEQALRVAVARYPRRRIIAFNLDSYDPVRLFAADGKEVWSYTNFEVDLLLRNRDLFAATRWYLKGRELSPKEAKAFWQPIVSKLHAGSGPLGYAP